MIAIARTINSTTEFKQIIGRGTRVRDDYGKLYLEIIDYTGSVVERFADPTFNGYPALATQEEIDAAGEVKPGSEQILHPEDSLDGADILNEPPQKPLFSDDEKYVSRKYYVDNSTVEIVANVVYELDPNGNRLRVVTYTEYTAEVVSSMYTTAADLRSKWSNADQRAAVIAALEPELSVQCSAATPADQPKAAKLDALLNLASRWTREFKAEYAKHQDVMSRREQRRIRSAQARHTQAEIQSYVQQWQADHVPSEPHHEVHQTLAAALRDPSRLAAWHSELGLVT